jgi:phage gp36-like protein
VQLTNEDPTVTTVNTAYLTIFLSDASNLMDMNLESRFALPFTDPPAVLVPICCGIAFYLLQQVRSIHDLKGAKEIYDEWMARLDKVTELDLTLGLAGDGQEPADPSSPAVVVVQAGGDPTGVLPSRIFSRGNLTGF